MTALMDASAPQGSREEFRRTPAAELPQLVDRILDNKENGAPDPYVTSKIPRWNPDFPEVPSGTLSFLVDIKRILSRPLCDQVARSSASTLPDGRENTKSGRSVRTNLVND